MTIDIATATAISIAVDPPMAIGHDFVRTLRRRRKLKIKPEFKNFGGAGLERSSKKFCITGNGDASLSKDKWCVCPARPFLRHINENLLKGGDLSRRVARTVLLPPALRQRTGAKN